MITNLPIVTPRLMLRNLSQLDITDSYLSWMQDPEVLRFLETRFTKVNNLAELISFVTVVNQSTDTVLFGMFRKDTKKHIGNIKLGPIKFDHARAEIGFLVGDRLSWGNGFASEAIEAVARFGLHELNLAKISAGCYEKNVGSMKALVKAGFTNVATIPNDVVCEGVRVSSLIFAKNR